MRPHHPSPPVDLDSTAAGSPSRRDTSDGRTRTRPARSLLAIAATVALLVGTTGPLAATAATPTTGNVVAWGSPYFAASALVVPKGLTDVTAVSAGNGFNLALRSDGTVTGWGYNSHGQATMPDGLEDVTAISAGGYHSLALTSEGTVVASGNDSDGQATVPDGLEDVTAISAGGYHSLALTSEGTVVAWGKNDRGEATVPGRLGEVTAVSAGYEFSVALLSDGTVTQWGAIGALPAGLSGVSAISAGTDFALALKSDGTVVAWGNNGDGKADVPAGLTDVIAVSAGARHALALRRDGTVVGWGDGSYGQLSQPNGLSRVTAIDAGLFHTIALGTSPAFTADAPPTTAFLDTAYSYTFTADGATTFQLASGALPAGLTLTPAGVLSGTPTAEGDSTFSVSTRNAFGITTSATRTITVATAVAPTISGTVTEGVVGSAYDYTYTVTGTPTPTVSVVYGDLPPGIDVDTAGRVSGTPTKAGTYRFIVRATSSAGTATAEQSILTVDPAPVAPTISGVVAAGVVDSAYDYAYTVTGTPTPAVTLASGALPPGLTLEKTGRLSGTPTTAGTSTFTVAATSTAGTATARSTLTISPRAVTTKADLSIDVAAPTTAVKGKQYAYTVTTKNIGPATSSTVYTKVILPPNTQFVSATGKYTRIGNLVIFQRSSLTKGQTVVDTITVKATGTGKGTALVTTFSVKTPDPSIRTNADTTTTTVR